MTHTHRLALRFSALLAPLLLVQGTLAPAAQLIVGAVKDNTIYADGNTLSNGAADNIAAGKAGGANTIRRGLVAFDLNSLPAGVRVDRVAVELMFQGATNQEGASRVVALHRLTSDWGEGTSNAGPGGSAGSLNGAPATTGDATWRYRFHDTQAWTAFDAGVAGSGGGDFAATASATATVGIVADVLTTWETLRGGAPTGLVADVEQWLANPTSNAGWLLKVVDESPLRTARRFYSREAATEAFRPRLVVDYTLIPEPAAGMLMTLCLAPMLVRARRLRRRFDSEIVA